jgi:hypothetical protein
MSIPLISKSLNFYPIAVTSSYVVPVNSYNVIYSNSALNTTITLPDLTEEVVDGFPYIIRDFGAGEVTILDSLGAPVSLLLSGDMILLIADKETFTWRDILGPIGGGSGGTPVTSSGLSTNNALARFNGVSGTIIKSSAITADDSGNLTGVGSIAAGAITCSTLRTGTGGAMTFFGSSGNQTSLSNTPAGVNIWSLRNTTDQVVGQSTSDVLTNKTLTSTTNNISANFLNSATTSVQVNGSTAPTAGQILTATNGTTATWQTPATAIAGPLSSTINAVALWNNTAGSSLKNSTVTIDNLGNTIGVQNLSMNGNLLTGNINMQGSLTITGGGGTTLISHTPSGTKTVVLPVPTASSDTIAYLNQAQALTNKTITDSTNNVNCNGLNTTTAPVITNGATAPTTGQVLAATGATAASWQSTGATAFTPTTSSNWSSTPSTIQSALDLLGANAGGVKTNVGVDPAVTATGNSQGTAYALIKFFTNVTTAAASTGVILPTTAGSGAYYRVKNNGANPLSIYPASGGQINALGSNTAFSLGTSTAVGFIATGANAWQSI